MQPVFVFIVRNEQDDTFVDEYVNFKVESVQELKGRIDLEGLFNKIIQDVWLYHERPMNFKLLDVSQEDTYSFEVTTEFTHCGETIKERFTIDFSEANQSDILTPFIKTK